MKTLIYTILTTIVLIGLVVCKPAKSNVRAPIYKLHELIDCKSTHRLAKMSMELANEDALELLEEWLGVTEKGRDVAQHFMFEATQALEDPRFNHMEPERRVRRFAFRLQKECVKAQLEM